MQFPFHFSVQTVCDPVGSRRPVRGFMLSEIMVAVAVAMLVCGIAMVLFMSALKHARNTEEMTKTVSDVRYATDTISAAVRSTPARPIVSNAGLTLQVAPNETYYATVDDTSIVDNLQTPNILGSLDGQRTIRISVRARQPATLWALKTAGPTAAISTLPSGMFLTVTDLPNIDLNDLFSPGDVLSIPGTSYGPAFTVSLSSINNASSPKTLTTSTDLLEKIPNGTQILASSGGYIRFTVESNGDLRRYPDDRNMAQFTVLARNIAAAPQASPYSGSPTATVPFVYNVTPRTIVVNLQSLPPGNRAGRTSTASETTIFVRTDPSTF